MTDDATQPFAFHSHVDQRLRRKPAGRYCQSRAVRIRHGRTLSPGDPLDYFAEMALCIANLLSGEYEAAAASGQRAIALNPGFSSSHKGYLAAMGHLGRRDAAAASLATLLKLEPGFSVEDAVRRSPFATAGGRALYADGLLTVGLRRTPRDH